jgi:hypothetical protein
MSTMPFTITRCSWPRPVVVAGDRWASQPEWDAPALPDLPQPQPATVHGESCWLIDWCRLFGGGLGRLNGQPSPGEMRGFHVVFRLTIHVAGALIFWDDDGSIIRRDGAILHEDRGVHPLARSVLEVQAGDVLEVAHWQRYGDWQWAARVAPSVAALLPYRTAVQERLAAPGGPPLKLYIGGAAPLRSAVAIYSMILNGYSPAEVLIFGDYQWSEAARRLLAELLPFARVAPTEQVLARIGGLGQPGLADLALRHWSAMKLAISLLCPPHTFCLMDDDVFILEPLDDALAAFAEHALVFAPDADYAPAYRAIWAQPGAPCIGRLNTGLFWMRNAHAPREVAAAMMRVPPHRAAHWQWEQGFMATRYAGEPAHELPTQRYFYPYFDGLPGGVAGYDYGGNPCGFASIHFGGLAAKPSDANALALAPAILGRRRPQLEDRGAAGHADGR